MCSKFDGNLIEVKTINEHYFRPQIKSLVKQKLLNYSIKTNDDEIMYENVFFFTDSSLKSFKSLQVNLRTLYENLKLRMRPNMKVNETSFNGGQDVDERLFLRNNSEKNNEISSNLKKFKIKQAFMTTPSSSLNLLLDMNYFNVLDEQQQQQMDTLTNDDTYLMEILRRNEIDEELIVFVEEFVIGKWALKIIDCLRNELDVVCVFFRILISLKISK